MMRIRTSQGPMLPATFAVASAMLAAPSTAHAFCMAPQEYVNARPARLQAAGCFRSKGNTTNNWHARLCPDGKLTIHNYAGVPERRFTIEQVYPKASQWPRFGPKLKLDTTFIEARTRKLIIVIEDGASTGVIMNDQVAPPAICAGAPNLAAATVETSRAKDVAFWRRARRENDD